MQSKKARNPVAPRPEEVRAVTIVNSVLDTHTVGCDDNTEEGKVDFDLAPRRERAATIALEVSSHRDSKLLAVWSSLDMTSPVSPRSTAGRRPATDGC
jgi:hypothetical protein